jgi:hypothetical protein
MTCLFLQKGVDDLARQFKNINFFSLKAQRNIRALVRIFCMVSCSGRVVHFLGWSVQKGGGGGGGDKLPDWCAISPGRLIHLFKGIV